MTDTQWWVVIICGGKIFVGLIFIVEGTHENFNMMKISAYTVFGNRLWGSPQAVSKEILLEYLSDRQGLSSVYRIVNKQCHFPPENPLSFYITSNKKDFIEIRKMVYR